MLPQECQRFIAGWYTVFITHPRLVLYRKVCLSLIGEGGRDSILCLILWGDSLSVSVYWRALSDYALMRVFGRHTAQPAYLTLPYWSVPESYLMLLQCSCFSVCVSVFISTYAFLGSHGTVYIYKTYINDAVTDMYFVFLSNTAETKETIETI